MRWTDQQPPLAMPTQTILADVWGSAANDVFVVGHLQSLTGSVILHYDGATWTSQTVPSVATALRSVWGTSASNVWAVGDGGVILRYDGSSWTAVTSGTTESLNAVWGLDASFVIAGGSAGTVLRYNGSTWSPITGAPAVDVYRDVWGTAPNNLYLVSRERVAHYNGASWMLQDLPVPATFRAPGIWGSGARDIYIATRGGVAHSADGTTWQLQDGADGAELWGVWGSGPTDVIAVGDGTIRRRGQLHWEREPGGSGKMLGATSTSLQVVVANDTHLRVFGSSWLASSSPFVQPSAQRLNGVWAAATNDVFVVAHLQGIAGPGPFLRWNGSNDSWSTLGSRTTRWRAVWGSSATDVYAVGADQGGYMPTPNGRVVHYNGATVTDVAIAIADDMPHAVWGTSSSDVFIATFDGVIWHYNGSTWSSQTGLAPRLKTLWGSGPNDVYVGGAALLRFDGTTWTEQAAGDALDYRTLIGWGPSDIFAATQLAGLLLHSDGVQWVPVRRAVPQIFSATATQRSIYFVGSGTAAVGWVHRLERACEMTERRCGDHLDDDCDGPVDCADPNCKDDASCLAGGWCGPATQIACNTTTTGDTRAGSWRLDNYRGAPRPETGPSVAYALTAETSGPVTATLSGVTGDLDVLVLRADPVTGACDLLQPVVAASTDPDAVTFTATAGATYYVVVDGYAGAFSRFSLALECL